MYKYEEDAFADTLRAHGMDKYKTVLLPQQIKAIIDKHPNDKIKFVFIDDRLDIMQALKNHFNPDNQCSLYPSLENLELKLIHYNGGYDGFLSSHARLNAETSTVIDAAKKRINCVATFPIKEQALIFNSINKKNQEVQDADGKKASILVGLSIFKSGLSHDDDSITDEEMADCAFGRGSNRAKIAFSI